MIRRPYKQNCKIVKILPKESYIHSDAVQLLESVIEEIKDGNAFAVAVVVLNNDRSVGTAWSCGAEDDVLRFVGGCSHLHHRAIHELLEQTW